MENVPAAYGKAVPVIGVFAFSHSVLQNVACINDGIEKGRNKRQEGIPKGQRRKHRAENKCQDGEQGTDCMKKELLFGKERAVAHPGAQKDQYDKIDVQKYQTMAWMYRRQNKNPILPDEEEDTEEEA